MKKIRQSKTPYSKVLDIRQEQLRFGKYLYLCILTLVIIGLVQILFGHWYLLKGEGFIYSNNTQIGLEFDATINQVFVKDGTRVKQQQALFSYRSLELSKLLHQSLSQIISLESELHAANIAITHLDANLKSTQKYQQFTSKFHHDLQRLQKEGLIEVTKITPEAKRDFDADQKLIALQKEKEFIQVNIKTLKRRLKELQEHYKHMLYLFHNGMVEANATGVITELKVVSGQVLEKGQSALKIFYGPREIYTYFNQHSWVSYQVGDYVIVNIPQHGLLRGKITKLLPITDRLPEEFQPRFKARVRQQIAVIDIAQKKLQSTPVMSTVSVYKPLGYQWYLSVKHWLFG